MEYSICQINLLSLVKDKLSLVNFINIFDLIEQTSKVDFCQLIEIASLIYIKLKYELSLTPEINNSLTGIKNTCKDDEVISKLCIYEVLDMVACLEYLSKIEGRKKSQDFNMYI